MTTAAIWIADRKTWAQLSQRIAMRRQSLSLANMFSTLWRIAFPIQYKMKEIYLRKHDDVASHGEQHSDNGHYCNLIVFEKGRESGNPPIFNGAQP